MPLKDRRGKKKPEDSLTEIEKLRSEVRLEKARRQQAEMEVSFLKTRGAIEEAGIGRLKTQLIIR